MTEFLGKTAVITGAANGIGEALAVECVHRGMKVVISDIDRPNLARVKQKLLDLGAEVVDVYCDVTEYEQWQNLAAETLKAFGSVELLFSNAGVTALGDIVNLPLIDFDFCMHTNLYSTFYALKTFVPILRGQGKPAHIGITGSAASISTAPGMPAYYAAKHAVAGLCEPVYYDFKIWGDPIGMTILCPAMVKTAINTGDTRRPEKYAINMDDPYYTGPVYRAGIEASTNDISTGLEPEEVVDAFFEGIEAEKLYVVPVKHVGRYMEKRLAVARNQTRVDLSWYEKFMKHDGSGDEDEL